MKEKVAIAIERDLLDAVDAYVDNVNVKSRSQAMEVLLRQSIKLQPVTRAVMLIHPKEIGCLFKKVEGKPLIEGHMHFLKANGIKELYIISKKDERVSQIKPIKGIKIEVIEEKRQEGTASALKLVKDLLTTDFVLFNGDTFNDFDLKKMIARHKQSKAICTMGLISTPEPGSYGCAILDGDMVIEFNEKSTKTNIINAGIYVMKPNMFLIYDNKTKSLENDLLPKLAKINHLQGYFTHGKYYHMPEL